MDMPQAKAFNVSNTIHQAVGSENLNRKSYAGVFLISAAALLFQVLLIRLIAVSHSYHFAFLVISIALFGLAVAGTILAIKDFKSPLFVWATLFSISALISFFLSNRIIFDPFKAVLEPSHILVLGAYYVILGVPFLFFALIIGWLFKHHKCDVGSIYFWNLLGSAVGAVSIIFLLPLLGLKTLLVPLALGLLSSYFFTAATATKPGRFILALAAFSLLTFVLLPQNVIDINVSDYKDLSLALRAKDSALLRSHWTVYGKTDLVSASFHNAPGLSLNYKEAVPKQLGIFTDATFTAAITQNESSEFANYLPEAIAAAIFSDTNGKSYDKRKALILHPSSYYAGLFSSLNYSVTVVEPNRAVADLISQENKRANAQATIFASDIRSFLATNSTKFDLVALPATGSQTAGFFSLSENYALTKEAFNEYYNHLSEGGLLIITRWLDFPPREAFRIVSALREANIPSLNEKLVSFNGLMTITFVIGKNSFSEGQLDAIQGFTDRMGYDLVYFQKNFTPNAYNRFPQPYHYDGINRIMKEDSEFAANYVFDVSAASDERPFFSDFFKWKTVKALYRFLDQRWQPFLDSGFLLWFLFLQAFVFALVFVVAPLLPYKRFRAKGRVVFYFFFIGLGFILVEVALIQKLAFFLGNITVSASLVLFSLLTFSGLGALSSKKLVGNSRNRFFAVIIIVCLLLLFYSAALQAFIAQFLGLQSVAKFIVAAAVIAPAAFLMGFPFPTAIRAIDEQSVPWAFAVNGAASVLGSVLAMIIASEVGYFAVLIAAAACYLFSLFVALAPSRSKAQTSLRL